MNSTGAQAALLAASLVALVLAGIRWLRVAQREHYLPGSMLRFAGRWWSLGPNRLLAVAAIVGLAAAAVQVTPAATAAALVIVLVALAAVAGGLTLAAAVATLLAVAAPLVIDVALAITAPVERRLAGRFVSHATAKLSSVHPTVVAITGSYGKTSTKGYIAYLLKGSFSVLASPASFNNRAGLARAINEHLSPGTEVFVAEMGTYGPGE